MFGQIVEEMRRPTTIVRQLRGTSAAAGILEEAAAHDLVIIGSWLNPEQPQVLVGRGLMWTVRQLHCPAVVIRPRYTAWGKVDKATEAGAGA